MKVPSMIHIVFNEGVKNLADSPQSLAFPFEELLSGVLPYHKVDEGGESNCSGGI